jgi:hypothetical protein
MMPSVQLAERLSIRTLRARSILHRAHGVGVGVLFFGPGAGKAPKYRFDSPDGSYGVCYLGLSEEAAFVEGVIHQALPRRLFSETSLAARAIADVRVVESIRAVRLYGKYLIGNGADAAVVHGDDYPNLSQPWSKAIHDHRDQVDGILYTARHDDSVKALALFERAEHKISASPSASHPLSGSDLRTLRLLDRYGIGLIP